MTNAATLTPLGVMVLALLREGDMHPYEMARLLRARRDDRIVTITNGTLYHTVARLHEQGLLAEVGVDRDGNRPERTTYTLTESGVSVVSDWVRRELGTIGRTTPFRVALAEAHNLERDEAVSLLIKRRELLQAQLDELDAGLSEAESREIPEQYLLELNRHRHLQQAEISWLDSLIPRIASPDFAWGPGADHPPARQASQNAKGIAE